MWLATAVVASSVPLPSKSQANVRAPPSGSDDVDPLKFTVSGAAPLVGVACGRAVGGWLDEAKVTRRTAPPSKSA